MYREDGVSTWKGEEYYRKNRHYIRKMEQTYE